MSSAFCATCMNDIELRVEDRLEVLNVRGEEIEVPARVAVCTACGDDVWSDEYDDETLAAAYALYRTRHRLLLPEEMTTIRKRWGLGQRAFSLLLGWGEITLHRYESGSVQDAAHDAQLRMAEHADNIRILLEANGNRLTPRQRQAIEHRLDEVEALEHDAPCEDEELERLLTGEAQGIYGGNVPLSLRKAREMIAFFAEATDVYVTKLAKLMFYADFLHHKENTTAISGLAYAHLTHGPVPEHYERLRADVLENGIVTVEERTGDSWAGEVLVASREVDVTVFSDEELQVLRFVRRTLGPMTSKEVSEMSHAEVAYDSTSMGRRIPYDTARELSLSLGDVDA